MKRTNKGLGISRDEIEAMFNDPHWAAQYPPLLKIPQVVELLQIPIGTIYQMSSQGRFVTCATRSGKHLIFHRNRLLQIILNDL